MGEIYENIDLYLNGALQGPELESFEARLASDKEFADEVRQRYILIQAIKEARKAELKQYIKDRVSPAELNKPQLRVKPNRNLYMIAAAASIAIAATAIFLLTRYPKQQQSSDGPAIKPPVDTTQVAGTPPAQVIEQDKLAQEDASKKSVPKVPEDLKRIRIEPRSIDTMLARAENDDSDGDGVSDMFDKEDGKVQNQYDNNVVKRDEKIWDTTLLAKVVAEDLLTYGEVKKNAEQQRKDSEPAARTKTKTYPRSYDRTSNNTANAAEILTYQVEYWKSPINFQGYILNGRVIKLYGIDRTVKVQLLSYQGRLYLNWGADYYKLEPDGKSHEYVKEADPVILNVLKKN